MESVNENLIRDLVYSQRKSYIQVSEILKEMFSGKIGFSRRSVQRYCLKKSISARVKQEEVTTMVARAVNEVDNFFLLSIIQHDRKNDDDKACENYTPTLLFQFSVLMYPKSYHFTIII